MSTEKKGTVFYLAAHFDFFHCDKVATQTRILATI
jgi:hypothetical protein